MTQDDKMPELKPCPFCGGFPAIERGNNGSDDQDYDCIIKCDCEHEPSIIRFSVFSDYSAIVAWNRRADLAQGDGIDVKCSGCLKITRSHTCGLKPCAYEMTRMIDTQELVGALDQILDDLSAGTMKFPGHGVCEEAWDNAIAILAKHKDEA